MARAVALHIGLNRVDPEAYSGWSGRLTACENDARSMRTITAALGYQANTLLTSNATAKAVFKDIARSAATLAEGDIFVLTYAGHGGQFRDLGGEETDQKDETWCLFDREVLDDEIYSALAPFRRGVRVLVVSDSCHSGTVVRQRYVDLMKTREFVNSYQLARGRPTGRETARSMAAIREVPGIVQEKILEQNRPLYSRLRADTARRAVDTLEASVLLLSACQDNQEALDGDENGAFTGALLDTWDSGAFDGNYQDFKEIISRKLPPSQSPGLGVFGSRSVAFERQRPFSSISPNEAVDVVSTEETQPSSPAVGPTNGMSLKIELTVFPNDKASEAFFDVLNTVANFQVDRAAPGSVRGALTAPEAEDVRRMRRTGKYSLGELSEVFGLSIQSVRDILRDK